MTTIEEVTAGIVTSDYTPWGDLTPAQQRRIKRNMERGMKDVKFETMGVFRDGEFTIFDPEDFEKEEGPVQWL